MSSPSPDRLQGAVAALCPEIEQRVRRNERPHSERELWRELSCCLLSSQVPYDLADAAAQAIDREGLLLSGHVDPAAIEALLSAPLDLAGRLRRYRFPVARAAQLAATHQAVIDEAGGLVSLLDSFVDAGVARRWFVTRAPGFGPKQASMFLRNVGYSYDLAVLDRHVLNYMLALGLTQDRPPGTLTNYRRWEAQLTDHARELGYPVGLLDWAIWIVVRTARGMRWEVGVA
ncbi:8-oxoguanine DNA glycosylase [Sphingopyxis terrae]|uniref:N-glycosylase/DNA lyase n=1 Tax=Sphingopyxis terrae subsp. ummariensis TaxID=429001 RepID=A0A1Y6FS74_9SPHN|nr:hypothetical protein [Sphingopyxis terrae]PCF91066.1 DNA lyase [Sphingopyxis terrae subsp. ummariensis]SMQ76301.1 N-glycosylase/DNA lyase [Sphingopyxis terrae subsp. ummariensis]